MRFLIAISIVIFYCGCTEDVVTPSPKPLNPIWPDSAIVNINGLDVMKYIKSNKYQDTLLFMQLASYNGALYYPLEINYIPMRSGQYFIHKLNVSDSITTADYTEICCYGEPDQINEEYDIYEADSAQNYIQVLVNKPERKLSAALNAVFVNKYSPFDTVSIRCDMLISRW